jgi:DNA-binding SARP family transcriptional activator
LRRAENPTGIERLDAALRILAATHLHTGGGSGAKPAGPIPQVVLRRVDGGIDVFLRHPSTKPPPPWRVGPDDRIWTLPASATLHLPQELADMPAPCPAVVQLGITNDGAELYVDLEALGVLVIDAHSSGAATAPAPPDLRAIARAITATLATSPLAELPYVRTLGFDPFGFSHEDRIHPASDLDDLISRLTSDRKLVDYGLEETGTDTTIALRVVRTDESWNPAIAVVAGPGSSQSKLDSADLTRLTDLAADGSRGVAVVIPATPDATATWRLIALPETDTVGGGQNPGTEAGQARTRWRLDPLRIALTPVALAAEELRQLSDFLAEAEAPLMEVQHPPQEPAPTGLTEPDWRVMVRLLGRIDAVSRDGRILGRDDVGETALQVLAWLATHRHGTRAELDEAVWPNGVSDGHVRNLLTQVRVVLKTLGGFEATEWKPVRTDLNVPTSIVTDIEIVQERRAYAERHRDKPEVAIPALQAAMDLVRGVPTFYSWLDGQMGSTLTFLPTAVAILLAEFHLDRQEYDELFAVTERGLAIVPAHPRLVGVRMRAHAARGDPAAVEAEYNAYVRAEASNRTWDGQPDRDLVELFDGLRRKPQ